MLIHLQILLKFTGKMSCVITDFDNRQTASKNIFISAIPPKPASKVFKYVFSPLTFTYVVNRPRYADMNILEDGERPENLVLV